MQTYYNSLILQAVKDIAERKDKLSSYTDISVEDGIPTTITINDKGDITAFYNTEGKELLLLNINDVTGDVSIITMENFNADLNNCYLDSQTGEIKISYIN